MGNIRLGRIQFVPMGLVRAEQEAGFVMLLQAEGALNPAEP